MFSLSQQGKAQIMFGIILKRKLRCNKRKLAILSFSLQAKMFCHGLRLVVTPSISEGQFSPCIPTAA